VAVAVGTFVLVVVLHAIWDAAADWPTYLIIGGISLVLLIRQARKDLLTVDGRARPATPTGDQRMRRPVSAQE
jgi:hypothetical protein